MNDGGPAFPYPQTIGKTILGMSLRDWFAGQALQVIHSDGGRYGPEGMEQVAKYAYAMADAMLKKRETTKREAGT